jgi:hypothetical protein
MVQPHGVARPVWAVQISAMAVDTLGHDAIETDGKNGLGTYRVESAPLELCLQCIFAQLC